MTSEQGMQILLANPRGFCAGVDRAIEIAKEENFALLLINTNRGFRQDNPLLRKNVDFTLDSPTAKNRAPTSVKKEYFAHRTDALDSWHRLPRKIKTKLESKKHIEQLRAEKEL